jgi:hypothetical protein
LSLFEALLIIEIGAGPEEHGDLKKGGDNRLISGGLSLLRTGPIRGRQPPRSQELCVQLEIHCKNALFTLKQGWIS